MAPIVFLILKKNCEAKKSIIISNSHFQSKILFNKKLSYFVKTFSYFLPDTLFKKCQSLNQIEKLFIKCNFQSNFWIFISFDKSNGKFHFGNFLSQLIIKSVNNLILCIN